MPSWHWRITVNIFSGTPKRATTTHNSSRSTESCAFWRSMKHMYGGIFLACPRSCSRRTPNSISIDERAGQTAHCSSGSIPLASQELLRRDVTIFSNNLPEWATSDVKTNVSMEFYTTLKFNIVICTCYTCTGFNVGAQNRNTHTRALVSSCCVVALAQHSG